MEKYIYDQNNGLWYELQGDYYIPCLMLDETDTSPIGMWGRRHLNTSESIDLYCTPVWCSAGNYIATLLRWTTGQPKCSNAL